MGKVLAAMLLIFAGVLAYVVGQRMSTEAMSVVIGVIVGVAAGIPTSLIVASVIRRAAPAAQPLREQYPVQAQQPMIVVNPFQAGQLPLNGGAPWQQGALTYPSDGQVLFPMPRQFRIVGADPLDDEVDYA